MERQRVESSSILSIGYDEENRLLEIEFISGDTYHYLDVPQAAYLALMVAPSKGRYVNEHVKDGYEYRKVSQGPAPFVRHAADAGLSGSGGRLASFIVCRENA